MSLRLKMILAFILCLLLVICPLIYIIQTQIKTNNMENFKHQALQLIDSKSNEIGSWLNQRISEIRVLKTYPPVKNLDIDYIRKFVTDLNYNISKDPTNYKEGFAIGKTDGIGWVTNDLYIDVSMRDYFKNSIDKNFRKEYIISNPVNSKSDNVPIFLISSPIVNDNYEKVGFINGSVSLEKLSQIAKNIDVYNGFSWIMNTDMNIYTIDKSELLNNYISSDCLERIVDNYNKVKTNSLAIKNISGNDSTLFYSHIPYTDNWILCTMVDNEIIHKDIDNLLKFIISLSIMFLLLASILAIFISGTILKPLKDLKLVMQSVSNGNLNSYYISNRKDEVSILGSFFNEMLNNIKQLIKKMQNIEKQKRTAELKILRAQINPHFLYNTLDTISWKAIDDGNFEIYNIVSALSGFFRISLSSGKEFITIDEEISHVKYYLDIQKIRYKDKIKYNFFIEENINHYLIPKLILQPIVENALYHGLKPYEYNGEINIYIKKIKNNILIEIIDNGIGIKKELLDKINYNLQNSIESEHYGLYNVNERLILSFGKNYTINIKSKYNNGTKVIILLPIISEGFECIQ